MANENKIQKVLVAGPNGNLGPTILKNLKERNFDVTLLTRNLEKTQQSFPDLPAFAADYDSVEQLQKVLKDDVGKQDALIVLIERNEDQAQINLMDAAIAAGIPHIIPSCFGITSRTPEFRRLPIWNSKCRMEDYVVEKSEAGAFTFTGIQNGSFLDWALEKGVFLNPKGGDPPFMVFDGGDVPFSATLMDDIGKAVAVSLLKVDKFRNKFVNIQSAVITQNQLARYAKELAPDREFKSIPLDTAVLEKAAFERYNAGDTGPDVMYMFMPRVTFGNKLGLFDHVDNEELEVEQMSEEQVKELVGRYI